MKMIQAKLYAMEEEKRRQEAAGLRGEQSENGWGSQIRSYVLLTSHLAHKRNMWICITDHKLLSKKIYRP